jgi:hypothetical protein
MCIRDDQGRFVTVRIEWIKSILNMESGETIRLLHALKWTYELQLQDINFKIDCKRVVDSLYNKRTYNLQL